MAKVPVSDASKNHRPFICGLCMAGFNKIDLFYVHFKKHCDIVKKECFHVCDSTEFRQFSRQEVVVGSNLEIGSFTCMGCSHAFPTVCQLHKHLSYDKNLPGSYVVDIKASSAFPTLNECPGWKDDKDGGKTVRNSIRTRRGLRATEARKLNKSENSCRQETERGSNGSLFTEVTMDSNILRDKTCITGTSQNMKSADVNVSENSNSHGSLSTAQAELTFMKFNDLPTSKEVRGSLGRSGNILKCMVNFETCKVFSDKECQVNIPVEVTENQDIENAIESYLKEPYEDGGQETNANKGANSQASPLRSCRTKGKVKKNLHDKMGVVSESKDKPHKALSIDRKIHVEHGTKLVSDHSSFTQGHSTADEASDSYIDGDDDDDFLDDQMEIDNSELNSDLVENVTVSKLELYPANDFARETIGNKVFLYCEICDQQYQQCHLIKHIENCHSDEQISDSFRQKILVLTLQRKGKRRPYRSACRRNSLRQINCANTESISSEPSESVENNSSLIGEKSCGTKQTNETARGKLLYNDKSRITTDDFDKLEDEHCQNKLSLSLKSVFTKIDKNCIEQAVKTSKKKYYPCKLCGVLIENYKLTEHEKFHNTVAGKILFSPENLQQCKTCGRVLRKTMFQNHVCLLLKASDKTEVDTVKISADQTISAPQSSQKLKAKELTKNVKKESNQMVHKHSTYRANSTEGDRSTPFNLRERLNSNKTKEKNAATTEYSEVEMENTEENSSNSIADSCINDEKCTSDIEDDLSSETELEATEVNGDEHNQTKKIDDPKEDVSESTNMIRKYFAEKLSKSPKSKKKYMTCGQCGMFIKYERMKTHNALHKEHPQRFKDLVKCKDCSRTFYRKNYMKNHDCTNSLKVSIRKRKTNLQDTITEEKKTCVDPKPADNKDTPNRKRQSTKGRQELKKKCSNQRWICYECGKNFSSERTFTRHRDREHNNLVFMCHICMKMLTTAAALEQHVKIHADIRKEEPKQGSLQIKTARVKQAVESPTSITAPNLKNAKSQETISAGQKEQCSRVWIPGQAETDKAVQSIMIDTSHHDLMISQPSSINFSNNTIDNSSF